MALNWKRVDQLFRLAIRKEFFTVRVGDTGTGCSERLWMTPPPPEGILGRAGWGFEQPGLEGGVPAYSRGVETT